MEIQYIQEKKRDIKLLLKMCLRKWTNNWEISISEQKLSKKQKNFHVKVNYLLAKLILEAKRKRFFQTDMLSNTGTLMKLPKNLVTIPVVYGTRYLIKIIEKMLYVILKFLGLFTS